MPEPIESMEVAPSEENGNVSVETETPTTPPNETPTEPETPTETPEPVTPTEPEGELYELPDGRKVDGETLTREWKENFLPEFTRKSQELATLKTGSDPNITNPKPIDPLADPEFVPQSYAELAEAIEKRTIQQIEAREQAVIAERKAIEDRVSSELTEIKTVDPKLNENALFLHATKYGFNNLKAAYQNMSDMAKLAKNVQTTTEKNILKRNDPVSSSPGATGVSLDPGSFATAVDYLRAQQGK
jgi:hypothetical protein